MSVLDTADTIRARYEGAAPQLDPEGFRLFRAAGEITGIRNLWEEFPYEDACGRFEEANGHELLRYLTAAHFGAVSWEVVPGTTYERAILREVDTSTEEYQAFARQLYAKALERMGLENQHSKRRRKENEQRRRCSIAKINKGAWHTNGVKVRRPARRPRKEKVRKNRGNTR